MTVDETVLVLDGHTNQALACVRSLGRAGYKVLVASDRRWPLSGWSRYCRGRFRLAGQTIAAFAEMRAWAYRQGAHLVLPATERACFLCNTERLQWQALGITVGCAPQEMLLLAFDKARTLQLAETFGIRIPPTRFPASLAECRAAAEEVGFPCVIKPRLSNAWDGIAFLPDRGTSYARDRGELEQAVLARKQGEAWPLIQGFVSGEGKGVFALCDHGRVLTWFAHQRLRDVRPSGSGSSLRRSVALEARLQIPAERLLAHLHWHGPAMVEFRDNCVGEPCLMEVNGRFWTSLQLAVAAGVDFPRLWVAILQGKPVEAQGTYAEGLTLRWLWGDVRRFFHILAGSPAGYPGAYPTVWQGMRELLGAQPPGTCLEVWQRTDPRPAIAECVDGFAEILSRKSTRP